LPPNPRQVNTSGEESKYGVDPPAAAPLAGHIAKNCPHLKVAGLMTIGMPDYSSRPENFECLSACRCAPLRGRCAWRRGLIGQRVAQPAGASPCVDGRTGLLPQASTAADANAKPKRAPVTRRDEVAAELGVPPGELELSMGMSGDYEAAVGRPGGGD
jgi:uncharacterized pyridoxal phosphate-containing UPF0001 family protein